MLGQSKTIDVHASVPRGTIDLDTDNESTLKLVCEAEEGNAADQALSIRQALGRYKKATAWAMALSVCLVMDGFDVSTRSTASMTFSEL